MFRSYLLHIIPSLIAFSLCAVHSQFIIWFGLPLTGVFLTRGAPEFLIVPEFLISPEFLIAPEFLHQLHRN